MKVCLRALGFSGVLALMVTLASGGGATAVLADPGGGDGGGHHKHASTDPPPPTDTPRPPAPTSAPKPASTVAPQPTRVPSADPTDPPVQPRPTPVPVPPTQPPPAEPAAPPPAQAAPPPPAQAAPPPPVQPAQVVAAPPPASSSSSHSRPRPVPTPVLDPNGDAAPKATFTPPAAVPPAPAPLATPAPDSVANADFTVADDFAPLQAQLGALLGLPLATEQPSATTDTGNSACDQEQPTTGGLLYLRCATGLPTFVADPDGLYHWAWLGDRLVAWIGTALDPPDEAFQADLPVCVGPATARATACPLRTDLPVAGFLSQPGDTDTYVFNVSGQNGPEDLTIDLTGLPADYDLYLSDSTGELLAQSVQDGTVPEHIEQALQAGTFYVYVHVDVGRVPDPAEPYTLRLSDAGPLLEGQAPPD